MLFKLGPHCRDIPMNSLHTYEVNYSRKGIFRTNWHLQWQRIRSEAIGYLFHYTKKISASAVHLVDERKPRNMVCVGLTPNCF